MKKIVEINPIPLLLHLVDPIAVCLIDDAKIACEPFFDIQQVPYKAYNFIYHLYRNPKRQKSLPLNFVDHFQKCDEIWIGSNGFASCFGGTDHQYERFPCIDFIIKLENSAEYSVILKDFIYSKKSLGETIKLNFEVELSTFESFIIFSNICVNNLIYWWWELYKYNIDNILDDKRKILEIIENKIQVKSQYNLHLFSMNYLYYLRKSLQNLNISPTELLRLNGVPVLSLFSTLPAVRDFNTEMFNNLLNLDSLSENVKVLYFSYIKHLEYIQNKSFMDFQRENSTILQELASDVISEFTTPYKLSIRLGDLLK